MREWEAVLFTAAEQDTEIGPVVQRALDELNVSVPEFCEGTELSESTMYKIISGHRTNVQLENFGRIVRRIRRLEQGAETNQRTIGVITNRESFERVRNRLDIGDMEVRLKGYPSATVEEAIRQSILAERDGVDAIICGPITAHTVENLIHVPVVGLSVSAEQIIDAVEIALNKI